MAATYSPARATFLFVDYKGGSAFKDCVLLPALRGHGHRLESGSRASRAHLASCRAHLPRAPPSAVRPQGPRRDGERRPAGLPSQPVLVVDEFAALVKEVPEFVDGVVDIAQRGRSPGLHMILACAAGGRHQGQPAREHQFAESRARMADEDDSTDVLGVPLAAGFDPSCRDGRLRRPARAE